MITAVIIILVKVIQAAVGQEDVLQEFIKWTVTALYGTGTHYLPVFDSLGIPITFIGAIWFLLALFFARVFFAWIMKTKTPVVWIMVFFAIGFISARKIGWLPFSFQAGMCDVLFLYIGLYIREHELFQWQKIHPVLKLLMLGIWGYCVCFCGKMWLVSNSFTDGFMDIIGSICGTFVIVYLSQGIEKIFHHPRILPWIGRNSLGIMCAHVIVLDCWPVWPHVRAILTKISLPKSVCEVLLIFSTTALVTVILYFIPRINRKLFPAGKS